MSGRENRIPTKWNPNKIPEYNEILGDVKVTNPDGSIIGVTPTDLEGSQVTIGLAEVEITFSGTTQSIYIESDCENAGFIYVGKTGVTTTTAMAKLEPGSSITLELNDSSNAVYAISDTAAQTIRKLALL